MKMWPILGFQICFVLVMTWAGFMGLWTRSSVVVYRVYQAPVGTKAGMAHRSSARGSSTTQELDEVD
jgi:hypothetical protein